MTQKSSPRLRVLTSLVAAFAALVALLLLRTFTMSSTQVQVAPAPPLALDTTAVAQRLGAAIRARTVSHDGGEGFEDAAFEELNALLEASYPRCFAQLTVDRVDRFGLLFTWTGRDPLLPGALFAAHTDVVPVEPGSEDRWLQPPFSGAVFDGHVWGRGAIDDKAAVIGLLEAAEARLAAGWAPTRTLYLAFGHDEEVSGRRGAVQIAALLESRGVALEFVLDEGLVITDGIVPGLAAPAALIGLSEKGYLSLDLVASGAGGHSSMPPRETAVGILSGALARLGADPFPVSLEGPVGGMFAALGPEMGFVNRLAFANLWLLKPVVVGKLEAKPSTDATLRTTTAPTMLSASPKENVLASEARAVVNFRIHPSDSIESVIARVRSVIGDERVQVVARDSFNSEPSPVASTDSRAWTVLATSIREVAPEVVVAPGLVLGATDGRHYAPLAQDVYRFAPAWLRSEDTARIHGTNERISVENLGLYVRFYDRLIFNAGG